jgi:tetratricopeptide (TPR) repeat protein
MSRRWLFTLLCFFLILLAAQALAKIDLPKLVKNVQPAIVTILTYDSNKNILSQGSGFFIERKGHLVTNYHVLSGAYSAEVKTYEGKIHPIDLIVGENKASDLIIVSVKIPKESIRWLNVIENLPTVAERVVIVGSPLGLEQTVSEGIVSGIRQIPEIGKIIQISAPISPGSSGSPLLNMKGEVIGVATFQFTEGQNLNFAVPIQKIVKLDRTKAIPIAEWSRKRKVAHAEEFFQKGLIKYKEKEYETAISLFEMAVKENANHFEAWFKLGLANIIIGQRSFCGKLIDNEYVPSYCDTERFYIALKAMKQAIRLKPDFAKAYDNLSFAYEAILQYEKAVEAKKKFMQLMPPTAKDYRSLGKLYERLDYWEAAHEAYKQAWKLEPNDAYTVIRIASLYQELGYLEDAHDAFKEAIRIEPNNVSAHFLLGQFYCKTGNKNAALSEYNILIYLHKGLANELYNMIDRLQ